jgi:hypothetical protein
MWWELRSLPPEARQNLNRGCPLTPTRRLEPPSFLALNYGQRTPFSVLLAQVAYGAVLGAFYRLGEDRPMDRHPVEGGR